ncbi:putative RNA methylase [Micrococcus cohnii]|uniref:Putative RNA methylase n=1 Tax=Micrococcus cohnii TaxID=993416 RepID=A0A7W7M2B3_9MICC|nr:hypothetical protein [Micrococcus cohnii]MBB4734764.1 putative RNA methylase [Micrococcus cohnii]
MPGNSWRGGTNRPSGKKERFAANLAALEVLQELEEQRRAATEDEQRVLSGWSAWGALPELFDETATRTISSSDRQRVRELLGPTGWAQARTTTLNAHYTDPAVAQAMWDALESAGFEGGPVLEPGCGSGEFIGLAPESAQMVGVELDPTTARIAAHLHPDQQIHSAGFEKTAFQDDAFHATVGNVPFGNFRVQDATHNGMGHSIHNHFILKSLRLTAPGGYVAVMTSAHTMDSKRTTARREMARYGDLVGGVRLPAGAMAASAGTEVGTDVLVFRRRMPGEKPDADAISAWVEPGQTTVTDRDGNQHELTYSRWFGEHEAAVLGTVEYDSGPFGPVYTVTGDSGVELGEQVRERLVAQLAESAERGLGYGPVPAKGAELDLEPGLRFAPEPEAAIGHVRFNASEQRFERYVAGMQWVKTARVAKKDIAEVRALLDLRDSAAEVVASQLSP